MFRLQPLAVIFLCKDNQHIWNFFYPLFFSTSLFVLIKLAFILVHNQGIFWEGARDSMLNSYDHLFLQIELAATKGHVITLPMEVTQLSSGWRTAVSLGWQSAEVVKGPCEAGEVPGAEASVLLCVTVLWQESYHKKALDCGTEQDTLCSGQPQMKKGSWNNLGRKTIEFFIFWHSHEYIFIPNAKQALNPRTINGEPSIPGTITGFLSVLK